MAGEKPWPTVWLPSLPYTAGVPGDPTTEALASDFSSVSPLAWTSRAKWKICIPFMLKPSTGLERTQI